MTPQKETAREPRKDGHSALRLRKGKLETFDPHPHIGGEMSISITQDGYICSFDKESRTASTWRELIAWLTHHGEAALKVTGERRCGRD